MMIHTVIMAGGRGTRLWPQSRERTPKQLWQILDGKSMLQDTVDRVFPIVSPEHILVITGEHLRDQIHHQLPQVPPPNILVEPMGRNTAPCVGLAALYIDDPDACMVILASDHVVRDKQEFQRVLRIAIDVASVGENLVTFGVKPRSPETGFGYIWRGAQIRSEVYKVRKFTEKPDLATAQQFVASGDYYWNSGMFIWKVSTLMTMIERYLPDLYEGLQRIKAALGTSEEYRVIEDVFAGLDPMSIDYGIMEKAESTYVVPGDFGWNDVGSWAALSDVWESDRQGNTVQGHVIPLESHGNIVYADAGLTALIGVENLVVVKVQDTVLVCAKDHAQKVKDIVDELQHRGLTEYL
ncbi:NTP transferase domain-containing protein [candidate division KSB3 bacterium]|uniref:mannose-1-phosphate guanylyltransferase n=1 Tax=candidate division KSB3 bacterium TaxID=2044937 RepID=A0A9D5JX12_9BACT|nr:NTP transferase domain-containing protein [candidate division KSB3 bacterium]MBD3325699.1 NTP transferase domain-containing protein [candidate division KSB3 bacterium]